MKPLIVVAALLLTASVSAQSHNSNRLNSGNDMVTAFAACTRFASSGGQGPYWGWEDDNNRCEHLDGYIEGVVDTDLSLCRFLATSGCGFEIPDDVTSGQVYDVVQKYIENHPENRQQPANLLITLAIVQAWPKPQTN